MARSSTPGQRARLYLEAHRDARMTALPGEHKEAREEIMRQLERQDPDVKERALVGGPAHFDRALTKGEREYQGHWQREHGLDVGDVRSRRAQLKGDHTEGRRRPANQPKPPQPRRLPPRAARIAAVPRYIKDAARVPSPPKNSGSGLGLLYASLTAAVGFSALYLLLTKPKVATSLVGLATSSFNHLASPHNTLFSTPVSTSSSASSATTTSAINQALKLPAAAPAPESVGASVSGSGNIAPNGQPTTARAVPPANGGIPSGYTFDPSTDQYVAN